jgi:uncharacterized protein YkwD
MKRHFLRTVMAVCLAALMLAGMASPALAANNPYKALEEKSRQAVAAAIKDGLIPPGTTIYECAFSKDANGVTIVVQYKDKDGKWIDVATKKPAVPSSSPTSSKELLTDDELAEYVEEVFRLVNEEREEAGVAAVVFNEEIAKAALVRAKELVTLASHKRPDGRRCHSALDDAGIERRWSAENYHYGRSNPEAAMKAWMDSDGHRRTILNEKATDVGIAAYQADNGTIYWIQLFIKEK